MVHGYDTDFCVMKNLKTEKQEKHNNDDDNDNDDKDKEMILLSQTIKTKREKNLFHYVVI